MRPSTRTWAITLHETPSRPDGNSASSSCGRPSRRRSVKPSQQPPNEPLRSTRTPWMSTSTHSGLHGLLHSHAAALIQFPKVGHHTLPRTPCRAIRLHQRPIGMSLPVLGPVAAPHIHGAHPTDLFPACKRVGLHYTPLLPSSRTPSHNPALQTKTLPLTLLPISESK